MKKLGISMVLLCALLLLLAPQAASAKSHWHFYAGVSPSYSYVQAYPYYTSPYYTSPYYYYPSYSPYYYMYPRNDWGRYYHNRHEWREHHRHWH